jgi:hypothetical protein
MSIVFIAIISLWILAVIIIVLSITCLTRPTAPVHLKTRKRGLADLHKTRKCGQIDIPKTRKCDMAIAPSLDTSSFVNMLNKPEVQQGMQRLEGMDNSEFSFRVWNLFREAGYSALIPMPPIPPNMTLQDVLNMQTALGKIRVDPERATPVLDVCSTRLLEDEALLDAAANSSPRLLGEYVPLSIVVESGVIAASSCYALCNVDQIYRRLAELGICVECLSTKPPLRCLGKCTDALSPHMIARTIEVVQAMIDARTEDELAEILKTILDDENQLELELREIAQLVMRQCVECRVDQGTCSMPSVDEMTSFQKTLTTLQSPVAGIDIETSQLTKLLAFLECVSDIVFPTVSTVYLKRQGASTYLGFQEPVYSSLPYTGVPDELHVLKESSFLELRYVDTAEIWYLLPLPVNRKAYVLCPARFWTHCVHHSRNSDGGGRVFLQSRTFSDVLNRLPLLRRDEVDNTYYMTEVTRSQGIGDVGGIPEWVDIALVGGRVDELTRFILEDPVVPETIRFNLIMDPYIKLATLDTASTSARWTVTEVRNGQYFSMATSSSNIWNFDIIRRLLMSMCNTLRTCHENPLGMEDTIKTIYLCFAAIVEQELGYYVNKVMDCVILTFVKLGYTLTEKCTEALLDFVVRAAELVFTDTVMSWRLNMTGNVPLRMTTSGGDTMAYRMFPTTNSEMPLGGYAVDRLELLWDKITYWKDNQVNPDNVFSDTEKRRYGDCYSIPGVGAKWEKQTTTDVDVVRTRGVVGVHLFPNGEMNMLGLQPGTAGLVLCHPRTGDSERFMYWRSVNDGYSDRLSVRIRKHRLTKHLVIGMLCSKAPEGICIAPTHPEFEALQARLDVVKGILSQCTDERCTISEALAPFCPSGECSLDSVMATFCQSSQARQLDQVVCSACQTLGYSCNDDQLCSETGDAKCALTYWENDDNDRLFHVLPKAHVGLNPRYLFSEASFHPDYPKNAQNLKGKMSVQVAGETERTIYPSQDIWFITRDGSSKALLSNFRNMSHTLSDGPSINQDVSQLIIEETDIHSTFNFRRVDGRYLAYNGINFEFIEDRLHLFAQWLFKRQNDVPSIPTYYGAVYQPNAAFNLAGGQLSPDQKLEFQEYYVGTTQNGTYLELNARGTKNQIKRVSPAGSTDNMYRYWKAHTATQLMLSNNYFILIASPYQYDAADTQKNFYIDGSLSGAVKSKRTTSSNISDEGGSNVVVIYPTGLFGFGFRSGTNVSFMTGSTTYAWTNANKLDAVYPMSIALFRASPS